MEFRKCDEVKETIKGLPEIIAIIKCNFDVSYLPSIWRTFL